MLTSKNVEMVVVSSSIMGYNGWRVELQPKDVSHETCHCAMYPDKYTLPCFPLPAWHFPWGRHWQQAIRLFHAIPQSKVEPNLIAHNILIRCVGHRQWQSAVDLLMCQMRRHVSPDVVSYNSVTGWFQKDVFFVKFTWDEHVSHFFVWCIGGSPETNYHSFFQRGNDFFPGPGLLTATTEVLSSCDKNGRWPETIGLLEAMPAVDVADVISFSASISFWDLNWSNLSNVKQPIRNTKPGVWSFIKGSFLCCQVGR